MSRLLLCRQNLAKNPYYINTISTNVYSIEELSYYLCHNIYLIDGSIMNEELCSWIRDELKIVDLSDKLLQILIDRGNLSVFVESILEASSYCTEEEIQQAKGLLDELGCKNEFYRRKTKADKLLEKQRYIKAIYEYYKILELERDNTVTDESYGNVWHNIGVGYARMFLFDQASYCFDKAFNYNRSDETFKEYLYAVLYSRNKDLFDKNVIMKGIDEEDSKKLEDEINEIAQNEESKVISERLDNLIRYREAGQVTRYYEDIEAILENWKKEYRKSTD